MLRQGVVKVRAVGISSAPLSWFEDTFRLVRLASVHNALGMLPESMLFASSRSSTLV